MLVDIGKIYYSTHQPTYKKRQDTEIARTTPFLHCMLQIEKVSSFTMMKLGFPGQTSSRYTSFLPPSTTSSITSSSMKLVLLLTNKEFIQRVREAFFWNIKDWQVHHQHHQLHWWRSNEQVVQCLHFYHVPRSFRSREGMHN